MEIRGPRNPQGVSLFYRRLRREMDGYARYWRYHDTGSLAVCRSRYSLLLQWSILTVNYLIRRLPRRCPLVGTESSYQKISTLHRLAYREFFDIELALQRSLEDIGFERRAG